MNRETEAPPVADEESAQDRSRRETYGTRAAKRQLYISASALVAALTMAVPALVTTCQMQNQVGRTAEKVDQAAAQTRQVAESANAAEDVAKDNSRQLQDLSARHREQLMVLRSTLVELARNCGLSKKEVRQLQEKVLSANQDADKASEAAMEGP